MRWCFLCLPSALWYSMQNSQWLCLIFFLSNLPLSRGYEALHGIPFLKIQIATSPSAWLILPTKCSVSIFSLAAGTSYNVFLCFPPFPVMTPSWRVSFKIKGSCAILWLCFHFVCNFPFQCWGPTQARAWSPHKHSSSASACSLHCWQYCEKWQSLVTLLE